jgi:hypothetical protein
VVEADFARAEMVVDVEVGSQSAPHSYNGDLVGWRVGVRDRR